MNSIVTNLLTKTTLQKGKSESLSLRESSRSEWIAKDRLDGEVTPVLSIDVELVVMMQRHNLCFIQPICIIREQTLCGENNVTRGKKKK